jgi:hypothetical protein
MTCLHPALRRHALRLATALFVLGPAASVLAEECALWNVGGQWNAVQSNSRDNTDPLLSLQQNGTEFKGTASYKNGNGVTIQGPVVGTVRGNAFEATIYWRGRENQVGLYSGQIGPQGLVVGRTYDKNHPATQADWHADHAFDCRTPAAANNGNGAKPPVALGRTQAPSPSSSNLSQTQVRQTRDVPAAGSDPLSRSTGVSPLATPGLTRDRAATPVPQSQPAAAASAPSLGHPAAPGAFR